MDYDYTHQDITDYWPIIVHEDLIECIFSVDELTEIEESLSSDYLLMKVQRYLNYYFSTKGN